MILDEFDEQMPNAPQALALFRLKVVEYRHGTESFGVVCRYEEAALRRGVDRADVESTWRESRAVNAPPTWGKLS